MRFQRSPHVNWVSSSFHIVAGRSFSTDSNNNLPGEDKKNEKALVKNNGSKAAAVMKAVHSGLLGAKDMIMNPKATWQSIKEVAHHYWMGSKLLWSEMKLTREILGRVVRGHEMTRRERRQLIRTTMDMFRLVPFAVFVIVPFMEFLLPFALKLFPNMLPSTFQDTMKEEENMKKELQMRMAVARFFQDTMQEMANKKSKSATGENSGEGAKELLDFVESAQKGRPISNEIVIKMAKNFKDELTLPNIARPQLVSMCRYMGINPYGSDDILRFQLRNKIRALKEDDRRILWEGVDSLNTLELREACRERGMRSSGLTQFKLKSQLQEWLELSTQKSIPISLLIMSRAFNLTTASDEPEEVLKSSMSALDPDTINEIVVATATNVESDSLEMRRRKLESLKFQQEMIAEEIGKRDGKKNTVVVSEEGAVALPAPSAGQIDTQSQITNVTSEVKRVVELSVKEIQVLADVVGTSSSLNRSRAELDVLQAVLEALLLAVKNPSVSNTIPVNDETAARGLVRLHSLLQSLLSQLPVTETSASQTAAVFNLLDHNNDGFVSREELRSALVRLLQKHLTTPEITQLVSILDTDQDGKISIAEMLAYVERQKESMELRGLEGGEVNPEKEVAAVVNARSGISTTI